MIEHRYRVSYEFTILLKTNAIGYELKRLVLKHIKATYSNLIDICKGKAIMDAEYHAYCIPSFTTDVDRYEFSFDSVNEQNYLPYSCNRSVDCIVALDIKRYDGAAFTELPVLTGFEKVKLFKKVFTPYFDKLSEDYFKIDILADRYL